jgi:hypothetical protein
MPAALRLRRPTVDPTRITYISLSEAHDFFNKALFEGQLPHCLLTMRRHAKARAYFSSQRFSSRAGGEATDEIALDATQSSNYSDKENLSALVHEMVHQWQHHLGTPSRPGYHNREWAGAMVGIGLVPSSTGLSGGKQTGQRMKHYIEPGGRFDAACGELLAHDAVLHYVDNVDEAARRKKAASKTRFTCPECHCNAWGKLELQIACIPCERQMLVEI